MIPYVAGVLGEAAKTNASRPRFIPGVTDFPTAQPAPLNRVELALEQVRR